MRLSSIDSDRGTYYTILCYAIAYGLVLGCVAIPLLYAFGWIAGMLFIFLTGFLWIELAAILAAIVYFTGVFLTAVATTFIYTPAVEMIDSVAQQVTTWWNTIISTVTT